MLWSYNRKKKRIATWCQGQNISASETWKKIVFSRHCASVLSLQFKYLCLKYYLLSCLLASVPVLAFSVSSKQGALSFPALEVTMHQASMYGWGEWGSGIACSSPLTLRWVKTTELDAGDSICRYLLRTSKWKSRRCLFTWKRLLSRLLFMVNLKHLWACVNPTKYFCECNSLLSCQKTSFHFGIIRHSFPYCVW